MLNSKQRNQIFSYLFDIFSVENCTGTIYLTVNFKNFFFFIKRVLILMLAKKKLGKCGEVITTWAQEHETVVS